MPKDFISLDYETFSEVSLPDVGTSVYASHPSTEVLMAAWQINDGEVDQWDAAAGEPMPKIFAEAMLDPEVEKRAWNAPFEINITWQKLFDVNVREWRCSMVQALHCSLPGSLEKAGPVVGLPEAQLKDRAGGALMRKFSFPRKPSKKNPSTRTFWHEAPTEWEAYKLYNRRDVVAEAGVMRRLRHYTMSEEEQELWYLDQEINAAGLPINLRMVNNAIRIYEQALQEALDEMREITGLANPNSPAQLLPWLQANGYIFEDCQKGHINTAVRYFKEWPSRWPLERWLEYCGNEQLLRVLQLRAEVARTSIKKYYALQRATDTDGHLRYVLQMNGAARTGRYAGRIYQPQNLARPEKRFESYQHVLADGIEHLDLQSIRLIHGNPFDVLASGLRPSAQAPEGKLFIDADLGAIENRVLGWLTGCDKILDVFRRKQDPYISFATYLYGSTYDALWHEYKVEKKGEKRTIAKPGTLGCGYGMGPGKESINYKTGEREASGLLGYAWNMGVTQFTEADSKLSVDTFRREFSEVKDYWYGLERAARKCVQSGQATRYGVLDFEMRGPFMCMILPSKRPLYYLRPRLEMVDTPWGEPRLQITYEGMNDKKQWQRLHTTPGKITENADQAISRDLLVHGMKLARKRGLDMRLHVHDQIVGLVGAEGAQEKLDILIECMEEPPEWARDLPLGSNGHVTPIFIKD